MVCLCNFYIFYLKYITIFIYFNKDSHIKLGLESGLLIAVPIPEEFTSAGDVIQAAITEALDLAK